VSNFAHAVRSRCQLTGESPRYLLNGNLADAEATIATAGTQQAILEARVMRALMTHRGYTAHPLGVSHTQLPREGSSVIVHVDATTPVTDDTLDQVMAHTLLPVRTADGRTTGVAGLRIARRQSKNRKDLLVEVVGSNARLTIRANVQWRLWLPRWRQHVLANGCMPLWDADGITAEEQKAVPTEDERLAWLGSGLLRRIGIHHTVGRAYDVNGTVAEGLWRIQMSIHPGIESDHDAFVARLIAPAHGLPMKVASRSCTCGNKPTTAHNAGSACSFELRSNDPQLPGGLQLQFARSTPPAHMAAKLVAAGADRHWLARAGLL